MLESITQDYFTYPTFREVAVLLSSGDGQFNLFWRLMYVNIMKIVSITNDVNVYIKYNSDNGQRPI